MEPHQFYKLGVSKQTLTFLLHVAPSSETRIHFSPPHPKKGKNVSSDLGKDDFFFVKDTTGISSNSCHGLSRTTVTVSMYILNYRI